MSHSTTTIADVVSRRVERGLADLMLDIYHAAYCAGANLPTEAPADPFVRDLLSTLAGRHRAEILIPREWLDAPISNDELPGWLLSQQQQADSPQLRAALERQIALGDAQPSDGWGADGWPV